MLTFEVTFAVEPAGSWVSNGWSYSKMISALLPSVVIGSSTFVPPLGLKFMKVPVPMFATVALAARNVER